MKKKVESLEKNRPVDEQIYEPGDYEIRDTDEFVVKLYLRLMDGRWVITDERNAERKHSVTFKMWNYETELTLKKQATDFDAEKRYPFVDYDVLNRLKVQKLLKSWTFDRDNPNLKIHTVGDVLTDESYRKFMKLHPNIIKYIINRMNEVLELNG